MTSGDDVLRVRLKLGDAEFEAEGSASLVQPLFEEFKEVFKQNSSGEAPSGASQGTSVSVSNGSGSETELVGKAASLPLAGFVKEFAPTSNAERVAIIAYWLTHHEKQDTFTGADVSDKWRNTRWPKPGNLNRDIATAASDGYVEKEARGVFSMTGYGESQLEQLMAD